MLCLFCVGALEGFDEKLVAQCRNEVAFISTQPSRMAANTWACRAKIAKDAQLWGSSRQLIVRHVCVGGREVAVKMHVWWGPGKALMHSTH